MGLALLACLLAVSACGVSSQDEPQIIEESTRPPATATPSFETEASPPSGEPSVPPTTASASTRPPVGHQMPSESAPSDSPASVRRPRGS